MSNEKFLPIKIFEKRKDYDDRSTEGGGDSREPSWVLHGDMLSSHVSILRSEISDIKNEFSMRKEKRNILPMLMSTTVHRDALAKSHRGRITGVLEIDGQENVIGMDGDDRILSLVSSTAVLDSMEKILSTEENAVVISSISGMEMYQPYVEPFEKEHNSYRVRLINYNDFDRNNLVRIMFEQYCLEKGIEMKAKVRFTSDMMIFRVTLDSADMLGELREFEGLYSAEITHPIYAAFDSAVVDLGIEGKKPDDYEEYPVIGVLDSGIADIPYLSGWKTDDRFESYPEEYQGRGHGTAVAGIIEYGDELNGFSTSVLRGVRLFDATVFPNYDIYPEDLIENVREAIERNPDIKVWNMSLGTVMEADLDRFSEFGMALDNIQDENNVLIVKSVGNCKRFVQGLPKSRISQSADSIRSLVIGSIAQTKDLNDLVDINMPSPFTRVGPGPASIVKPDLVFYGGNAGVVGGKLRTNGVQSFGLNGSIQRYPGTSFSTPGVSRIAGELSFLLSEDFDPLLIRALLIHYAKYPDGIKMKMSDKIIQMGFGIPVGANDILYNSPDEITLILRDTLEKGSFIEMFDFPYPTSLVDENGNFTGQIILTVVNKSLVDEKQSGEYCQSDINVLFGTYTSEKERDISKPMIKNPRGVAEAKNILLDSLYSAAAKGVHPVTGFERECTLVKYGKKYHPVKKYAVDLADMTPSNKDKYLPSDRKWYLKIEGLYRDFIERDAVKKDYQLSQEYCMILTIRDSKHTAPVYDEVAQQLTEKNFVHYDVRVRNNVMVYNSVG